jgi:hydrogenase maturation protein HypF
MKNNSIENIERISIVIRGSVQGVGFRPFVYRVATELGLNGWVLNSQQGVFIEAEGIHNVLTNFLFRLQKETPPRAFIQSLEFSFLDPIGFSSFEIRTSDDTGTKSTVLAPDIATCNDCYHEIFDPTNRRYLYPFTNCTNCGPRFTIIESLPYDRVNTSMRDFTMCPECSAEYNDPMDRRFHAQPNACPVCGPHVELWNEKGEIVAQRNDAILLAVEFLRDGKIVAVKGIGGFHLMVDGTNEAAVQTLRKRKRREEKPFAIMSPSLEDVKQLCFVSELEERLLNSPESPIVLLQKQGADSMIAPSVAPRNPSLGVMLPYSPLHHILLHELWIPVVATSGNISDEPICIDEYEARRRLNGIADFFLVHNRKIVRHADDSIVRVMLGRELVLRRARGYAPFPISLSKEVSNPILAVGGHLKNTVALALQSNVFISQHIGDLETAQSYEAFQRVITDFTTMYDAHPALIACDLHPEYLSTKYAHSTSLPVIEVQHHCAHIASCMAENKLDGEVLGVAWDGTGFGTDGTIWGGEFFLGAPRHFQRIATFRPFMLIGGEQAIKEPRRSAFGILYEIFHDNIFHEERIKNYLEHTFTKNELRLFYRMASKQIQSPLTSSVGRLFDAVASLIGIRNVVRHEGQAAMELEYSCSSRGNKTDYPISFMPNSDINSLLIVDWSAMILGILDDISLAVDQSAIASKFHNTLVEAIILVAKQTKQKRVVLSGGCFQNCILTERVVNRLRNENFSVYWHQRVPPNDGGIALGQAVIANEFEK